MMTALEAARAELERLEQKVVADLERDRGLAEQLGNIENKAATIGFVMHVSEVIADFLKVERARTSVLGAQVADLEARLARVERSGAAARPRLEAACLE